MRDAIQKAITLLDDGHITRFDHVNEALAHLRGALGEQPDQTQDASEDAGAGETAEPAPADAEIGGDVVYSDEEPGHQARAYIASHVSAVSSDTRTIARLMHEQNAFLEAQVKKLDELIASVNRSA